MSDVVTLFDLYLTLCEHDQDEDALLERTFDRVGVDRYCSPADLAAVADETPSAESDVESFEFCFEAAAERVGADPGNAPSLARAHDDRIDHSRVSLLEREQRRYDGVRTHHVPTDGGRFDAANTVGNSLTGLTRSRQRPKNG